ncbi:nucleolus protein [Hysterangium stoloniferum]|nr:nucleolus protein [Hysterangium stoloniferum]
MAKLRRRRQPVTEKTTRSSLNASKPISGPNLIRRFHVLLKRRERLITVETSPKSRELIDINKEIEDLGGLETYQKMSVRGQSDERGGGSERILINWLQEQRKQSRTSTDKSSLSLTFLRLLEVGALKPDNYASAASWIDCKPIDLHSRHPLIEEQDFLKMDAGKNRKLWSVISLSLVINFVPNPHDRGKMLSLAHEFLSDSGYLFVALPLPCVVNSRYLDFDRLISMMTTLGFSLLKERWKTGGKMAYWLFQKSSPPPVVKMTEMFSKKIVVREGKNRNNFAILL